MLPLDLNKFLSGQHQRFQNDREAGMSTTQWFQYQAVDFYDTGIRNCPHCMADVSIPEVKILVFYVVVVDLGFTTLLTSQVIIVAFYYEREKSDKFCSEVLISA